MSFVERKYQERIDSFTPPERVEHAAAMCQWARESIARQIVAESGPIFRRA